MLLIIQLLVIIQPMELILAQSLTALRCMLYQILLVEETVSTFMDRVVSLRIHIMLRITG
ncbi:MAG: hypothetical protein AUG75_10535 [Cyanobacteria bacterium 13_1_20CM_4_61_6]|nr:MAG: hypothetical protein AUG75_10535 [Cyanobacteria bacterium 13_1_20CM_4_61_6]